jgi:hypothetical protein
MVRPFVCVPASFVGLCCVAEPCASAQTRQKKKKMKKKTKKMLFFSLVFFRSPARPVARVAWRRVRVGLNRTACVRCHARPMRQREKKAKEKNNLFFFFFFFVIKKFSFFLDSHALHAAVAKVLQDQTLARCGPKVEQAAAAVDSPAHRQHRSVRLSLSLSLSLPSISLFGAHSICGSFSSSAATTPSDATGDARSSASDRAPPPCCACLCWTA